MENCASNAHAVTRALENEAAWFPAHEALETVRAAKHAPSRKKCILEQTLGAFHHQAQKENRSSPFEEKPCPGMNLDPASTAAFFSRALHGVDVP